jgi:hypothetical protein
MVSVAAIVAIAVVSIAALNFLLIKRSSDPRNLILASQWQQQTRGITMASTDGIDNRPFKALRLAERAADINGLVLGSSTAMGITADMFPPSIRIYNFSQNSNTLPSIISELEYVLDHYQSIKYIFVPLEWSFGSLYDLRLIPEADLSPAHVARELGATPPVQLKLRFGDLLSRERAFHLAAVLGAVLASGSPVASFKARFLRLGGVPYLCADGIVRDFEETYVGLCDGFGFDGSSRFRAIPRVRSAAGTMLQALDARSGYRAVLHSTNGEPSSEALERLGRVAETLRMRGGRMIAWRPPLLPGLRAALSMDEEAGPQLRRTDDALRDWSSRSGVLILDAEQSEGFGCTPREFVDAHHAVPSCYRRIFAKFGSEMAELTR